MTSAALTKQLSKSKKEEEKTRIKTTSKRLKKHRRRRIRPCQGGSGKQGTLRVQTTQRKNWEEKPAGHLFVSKKDGQLPLTVHRKISRNWKFVRGRQSALPGHCSMEELELATKEAKRLKASIVVMEGTT